MESSCVQKVKETAYLTFVRPCLEYAFGFWHLYPLYLISDIGKNTEKSCQMDSLGL